MPETVKARSAEEAVRPIGRVPEYLQIIFVPVAVIACENAVPSEAFQLSAPKDRTGATSKTLHFIVMLVLPAAFEAVRVTVKVLPASASLAVPPMSAVLSSETTLKPDGSSPAIPQATFVPEASVMFTCTASPGKTLMLVLSAEIPSGTTSFTVTLMIPSA